MKLPSGLRDPQGHVAEGTVHLEANGKFTKEFGVTVDGRHSTCYVLVAPGDVLTANFAINSGISTEFADLVVDGILRNSLSNTRGLRVFKCIFDRAVYSGAQIGESRKAKTYARMQVTNRDSSKDIPAKVERVSSVGSLMVQIFRRETTIETKMGNGGPTTVSIEIQDGSGDGNGSGDASGEDASTGPAPTNFGLCERKPNFGKYRTWQDLNKYISSNGPAPSFQIGFFDGTKYFKKPAQRIINEHPSDFKVWASFTFLLRSTTELLSLGFQNIPLQNSTSLAATFVRFESGEPGNNKLGEVFKANREERTLSSLEAEDEPAQPALKLKMPTNKKSTNALSTDQPTTSTVENNLANIKEDDTAGEGSLASAKQLNAELDPKNATLKQVQETRGEFIARKKSELNLRGIESAPAHQAYLKRAPTEEPEDDDDGMQLTPDSAKTGIAGSIDHVQSTFATEDSRFPRHPKHIKARFSSPSFNLGENLSNHNIEECFTTSTTKVLDTSSIQVMKTQVGQETCAVVSAPSSPVLTNSVPDFLGSWRAPSAQMFPINTSKPRRSSLLAVISEPLPPPPSNLQLQICSTPVSPSLSSSSLVIRKQLQPLNSAGRSSQITPGSHGVTNSTEETTRPSTSHPVEDQSTLFTSFEEQNIRMTGTSRPSSPTPSETLTEVAESVTVETSRKASERLDNTTSGEFRESSPTQTTYRLHCAAEVPTVGHSQSFFFSCESKDLAATQKRLNSRSKIPPNAQAIPLSPPPSAKKRKADNFNGSSLNKVHQPSKIPFVDHFSQNFTKSEDSTECHFFEGEDHIRDQRVSAQRRKEDAREQNPTLQTNDMRSQWEDEILRQEQLARMRMTTAQRQRQELEARYRAIEKINRVTMEAERLERENRELQATIAALYRGGGA